MDEIVKCPLEGECSDGKDMQLNHPICTGLASGDYHDGEKGVRIEEGRLSTPVDNERKATVEVRIGLYRGTHKVGFRF